MQRFVYRPNLARNMGFQILGWARSHSKDEGTMQFALLMVQTDFVDIQGVRGKTGQPVFS